MLLKLAMEVIVYSAPHCPWCDTAKNFLKQHGIKFKEIDVSRDPAAAMELVKKSGQIGVPVIEINGQVVVGFDVTKLSKLLKIKA